MRTSSLITPCNCGAEKEYAVAGTRDEPVSNMECAVSLTPTPQNLKKNMISCREKEGTRWYITREENSYRESSTSELVTL